MMTARRSEKRSRFFVTWAECVIWSKRVLKEPDIAKRVDVRLVPSTGTVGVTVVAAIGSATAVTGTLRRALRSDL